MRVSGQGWLPIQRYLGALKFVFHVIFMLWSIIFLLVSPTPLQPFKKCKNHSCLAAVQTGGVLWPLLQSAGLAEGGIVGHSDCRQVRGRPACCSQGLLPRRYPLPLLLLHLFIWLFYYRQQKAQPRLHKKRSSLVYTPGVVADWLTLASDLKYNSYPSPSLGSSLHHGGFARRYLYKSRHSYRSSGPSSSTKPEPNRIQDQHLERWNTVRGVSHAWWG